MRAIIDRFEDKYAVLEIDREFKHIKKNLLPSAAKEGDLVVYQDNRWILDKKATEQFKKEIDELAKELWED